MALKENAVSGKIKLIFALMEKLADGQELYVQDRYLQDELGVTERTLRRALEDLYGLYGDYIHISREKREFSDRKTNVYKLLNSDKAIARGLKYFLQHNDDLSWLLQILHEKNPKVLRSLSEDLKEELAQNLKEDENIFLFKSDPFESLDDTHSKKIFASLKNAVKNHEYRDIVNRRDKRVVYKNAKCLKIIYSESNWYIAIEDDTGHFRLLRIAFLESVSYAKKERYDPSRVQKYNAYFSSFQNALTREGVKTTTARIKATPNIAIYFDEGMKPFLSSQKFLAKNSDGSIEFSLEYTHPMEILVFIKRWMPDLVVLEPKELIETYKADLHKMLEALQ